VRELVREELPAGGHEIVWNGRDDRGLPAVSGIYFARLRHGGNSAALKLVLIR
jgi:hypothetical protein